MKFPIELNTTHRPQRDRNKPKRPTPVIKLNKFAKTVIVWRLLVTILKVVNTMDLLFARQTYKRDTKRLSIR